MDELEKLKSLPIRTIVTGPEWNDEVYQKFDDDKWFGIAADIPWTSLDLAPRGPFRVLRRGA